MSNYLTTIDFNGKEIEYCNFSGVSKDELIKGLKDVKELLAAKGSTDLLILFDVTNTFFDKESFTMAIDFAKTIKQYRRKSALVGVTGGKKFLLNSLLTITQTSSSVKSIDDLETAKKWMIQ